MAGEALGKQHRGDAGEALWISAESRELERGDARLDHLRDAGGALFRIDGAVEREIDAGLRQGVGDLLPHIVARGDDVALVIGHVDDGGDAAGRRRAGSTR